MQSKDLAIGVLSTTAVILFVGLILLNAQPQPAYASGLGDRGGDYIAISGQMWAEEELLYVIDGSQDKMMVYRYDQNTKQIQAHGPADLKQFMAGSVPLRGRRRSLSATPSHRNRGRTGTGSGGDSGPSAADLWRRIPYIVL